MFLWFIYFSLIDIPIAVFYCTLSMSITEPLTFNNLSSSKYITAMPNSNSTFIFTFKFITFSID
jgi:hypothetical protein